MRALIASSNYTGLKSNCVHIFHYKLSEQGGFAALLLHRLSYIIINFEMKETENGRETQITRGACHLHAANIQIGGYF